MAISITQARRMCVELLNQSDPGSGYGTISAERYKSGEIDDWILAADAMIARIICNTPGNGHRKIFLTGSASGLAYGAQLADREGPLESVQFVITGGPMAGTRHAKEWPVERSQDLDRENLNPLALTRLFPHYVLDKDNTIYHNAAGLVLGGATSISVNSAFYVFTMTASPQSPDSFLRAVGAGALAALMLKDGQREQAAQVFEGILQNELKLLGLGQGQ